MDIASCPPPNSTCSFVGEKTQAFRGLSDLKVLTQSQFSRSHILHVWSVEADNRKVWCRLYDRHWILLSWACISFATEKLIESIIFNAPSSKAHRICFPSGSHLTSWHLTSPASGWGSWNCAARLQLVTSPHIGSFSYIDTRGGLFWSRPPKASQCTKMRRPLSSKVQFLTEPVCSKVVSSEPVSTSHTLACMSALPLTSNLESHETSKCQTAPLWTS